MGAMDKVLLKLEKRRHLLEELVKLELEREQVIADYFPGFAVSDKKLISERVEAEFFMNIEKEIEDAHNKELIKIFG